LAACHSQFLVFQKVCSLRSATSVANDMHCVERGHGFAYHRSDSPHYMRDRLLISLAALFHQTLRRYARLTNRGRCDGGHRCSSLWSARVHP